MLKKQIKKRRRYIFLIEQQSQIDYSMAYGILNYCLEIIRNTVDKEKLKNKSYKMPVVYPNKKNWTK